MPILSFGSQNINIITHKKNITIRKLWKTPLEKGDRLYCYWNLVSKEKKKIFEAVVLDVELISFKELKDNDSLAKEEGYSDAVEMVKELKKTYAVDIGDEEIFQIIHFEKLDVDDWIGDKINEKVMITQRADILFDSGKYDKSVLCYTAALGFDPNDVYLLNKKGDNLSRLGKFQDAIKCYDDALKIEADNEYIWNNKAIAYLNCEEFDDALASSNRAVEINPNNTAILYWRGFILQVLGKLDESLETYDKILEIDDTNPQVWNARGNILNDLGRVEEALDSYDKGMELCLDDSDIDASAQNRRGNALLELGRLEEAIECYDNALELEPKNEVFLLNKGIVLMELNEFQKADDIFTKILVKNPNNIDAQFLKEECLENL